MDFSTTILDILVELTGTEEVKSNLEVDLFAEGLLDSLGTVQMIVEIDGRLGVSIPVSEFERDAWNTPQKIIANIEALAE